MLCQITVPSRRTLRAGDDDDAVADDVVVALLLGDPLAVDDADVVANANILVDDGALHDAVVAQSQIGHAAFAILGPLDVGLEPIGSNDDGVAHDGVAADAAAHADDGALDARPVGSRSRR